MSDDAQSCYRSVCAYVLLPYGSPLNFKEGEYRNVEQLLASGEDTQPSGVEE